MWATAGDGNNLFQTWDANVISYFYEKTHNGEILLDNYHNMLNGLYHESFHQSEGIANSNSYEYPFDHFDIGVKQGQHFSFKNTTSANKDFYKTVMSIYLSQQESVLNRKTGSQNFDALNSRYAKNIGFFNKFLYPFKKI